MIGLFLALTAAVAAPEAAMTLGPDSLARDRLVAVGRDLVVEGRALSDVVTIQGSVIVEGVVEGDVIVLGGDVRLGPRAVASGDLFVLGGVIHAEPGAEIAGRAIAYPTVTAAWLTLLEGPSLGLSPLSPVVLGAKLALLAAWGLLSLILFGTAGGSVVSTSRGVSEEPFRSFTVGLTAVLTMTLTGLFLTGLAPGLLGFPLLVLVVLFALVLKLWGMVAVFHAFGELLSRRLAGWRLTPIQTATLGLLVLGLVRLVPWVGTWAWTAASLIAVGATLTTKLGRREPWILPAPSPSAAP